MRTSKHITSVEMKLMLSALFIYFLLPSHFEFDFSQELNTLNEEFTNTFLSIL